MSEETPATENAAAPAAKPKRMLVIGAVAIGSLAGLGAGVVAIGPAMAAPAAATADSAAHSAEGGEGATPDSASSTAPIVLSNLVMNPAGSRGTRFLLVSVGFEFNPAMSAEEFALRETEIRDRVIGVLSTKTVDDLVDYTRREGYRAEIVAALDSLLAGIKVRRVFFPQFVIQ